MSSPLDSVKNTDKVAFQDMRVSDQATEALRRDAISDEGFGKLGGSGSSSGALTRVVNWTVPEDDPSSTIAQVA